MIHAGDEEFGVASVWPEGGLRCAPGPSQGAGRQYRRGGFRVFGVRHGLHAEHVVSVVPADAGAGPGALELPDRVRDREHPLRQLCQGIWATTTQLVRAWSRKSSTTATTLSSPARKVRRKALTDFIDGYEFEHYAVEVREGKTRETNRCRFIDKVPLRDGAEAVLVNWIGFEILDAEAL